MGFVGNAQDSLTLYQHIDNQNDQLRILNKEYYYNPANMTDYSSYSFSNIALNYQTSNKESYLLQEGASHKKFNFETNSYKKVTKNLTLWGNASYTNTQTEKIQWNNNIDIERINPFVIADSIGGKMNLQTYNFRGGFAKNINTFTYGLQLAYTASLNYKTQDPRPKNTTSDLHLLFGTNYNLNNRYKIGLAAGLNRYIQTSAIKFSSEIRQNALYQMNGLGTYNFYFSNKSQSASYTDFSHKYLVSLGSTNNLFSITAGTFFGNLVKNIELSGNNTYETNRLAIKKKFASITKLYKLNYKFTIGGKIIYNNINNTGTEILYTTNTDVLSKLLENKNYYLKSDEFNFNFIIQFKQTTSNFFAQPFYTVVSTEESTQSNSSYQNFKYSFIGTKLFYLQQLNSKNSINVNANIYQRQLQYTRNNLAVSQIKGINEWLIHDLNIKKTNYTALEVAVRYDKKLAFTQSIYSIFAFDYYRFTNETNNVQLTLSLGISF